MLKISTKHILIFFFLVNYCKNSNSQSYLGLSNSQYGALYNLNENPSKILNSKNESEIKLLSGDYILLNNFYTLNTIFSNPFTKINSRDLLSTMTNNKYPEISSSVNLFNFNEINFLGFYKQFTFKNGKVYALAFNSKYRSLSNFNNIDRNIFQLNEQNFINGNTQNNVVIDKIKNFNFLQNNLLYTQHNFAELSLSFATELLKKEEFIIAGGVTLKRLLGISYEGFRSNNLKTLFVAPPYQNNYNLKFNGDFEFSKYDKNASGLNLIFPIGNIFSTTAAGWALDLGFSFEKSIVKDSNKTQNADKEILNPNLSSCYKKYSYKISLSIIDFGYTTYNSNTSYLSIKDSALFLDWNKNLIGKTNSYSDFNNVLTNSNNFKFFNGESFKFEEITNYIFLPARLHLDLDIPLRKQSINDIWSKMFINIAFNQSLFNVYEVFTNKTLYGNKIFSNITAETRYQTKNFDISLPLTTYTQLIPLLPFINIGLSSRYKHFSLGTSNIGSLVGIYGSQTINLYAGINYIIPYNCPPEKEIDSIKPANLNSYVYKDSDNDNVPDNKDKCPEIYGDVSNYGCPLDPDSVLNFELNRIAIFLKFIPDKPVLQPSANNLLNELQTLLIKNPNLKIIASGKADSSTNRNYNDNLILAQKRDSILKVEFQNRGFDSTRVKHIYIRPEQSFPSNIPLIRKLIDGKDEDRDGTFDINDRCPNLIGSNKDDGCTFIDEENSLLLTTSLGSKLEFWKGLRNFAYSSELNLDEVSNIMKKENDIKLLVRGFVGREILQPDFKYELSKKRADTIKSYLIQSGINSDRIIELGMSPYEPYRSVPTLISLLNRDSLDTDFDNVIDKIDRCPTITGNIENYGCPEINELKKYAYLDSLTHLNLFEKNNDNLLPNSTDVLLKIKDFIVENPLKTFAISPGVISNELNGNQKNSLSQARATKLKSYLVAQNVDENKLIERGLGYQQPLDAISTFMIIDSKLIDSDNDEVKDFEDKCPTIRGSISNYGCPQINEEDADLITRINRGINYEPNSDNLLKESETYLDSLLFFMAKNPNTTIITSGNVANPNLDCNKQNLINQQRAELIKNYLTLYGVSKNRVTAVGLSCLEEKPWLTPIIRVIDNSSDFDNDLTKDIYDKCPTTIGSTFNYGCPYKLDIINKKLNEISDEMLFDFDKYDLKPKTIIALDKLAKILLEDTTFVIIASGHADIIGTTEYNIILSLKRAEAVKNYLTTNELLKDKINPERIIVIGLGNKFPIADNKTSYGREQNRRVSIFLIE